MIRTYPSNYAIGKALKKILPELSKRYGGFERCTQQQVLKTCVDLKIKKKVRPYIFASCLNPDDLKVMINDMPILNWEEIINRSSRMVKNHKISKYCSGGTYSESGIGMHGGISSD